MTDRILRFFLHAQDRAARCGSAIAWLAPTLARIAVGTVFVQSGWGKLNNLSAVTAYFGELGLPAPALQAVLASTTEFFCGALLLVGLATRLAALPLIFTMMVAIRTALWEQVDGAASLFGLAEFLYIALMVWLAAGGPGPISADALLESRQHCGDAAMLPRQMTSVRR